MNVLHDYIQQHHCKAADDGMEHTNNKLILSLLLKSSLGSSALQQKRLAFPPGLII